MATDPAPMQRLTGLLVGPVLACATYLLIPTETVNNAGEVIAGLSHVGRVVAASGVLMATFWVTEAIPIPATALLPLFLFPLLSGGAISIRVAAAPYAHELIFLFMGGFLIALAMQHSGLHRRIALHTVLLVGTRPPVLVAGFMVATAFLSMWVSNTATVVMMLPIGASVIELVRRRLGHSESHGAPPDGRPFNFATCLMLGIAYAASIGGVGTLVGTPPNILVAAFLKENFGLEISFVQWMAIGLPLVVLFLPITWLLLTRWIYPIEMDDIPGGREMIRKSLASQGPMSKSERVVSIVFILTAAAWMTRPLLVKVQFGDGWQPFAGLSDTGIAIGAALFLFVFPIDLRRGAFLLTWRQARELPWGILILFGGGLSLASAVKATGVAAFLGQSVSGLGHLPAPVVTLLVTTLVIFLTELTSNTATTATFLPILAAVAVGLGVDPLLLVIPAAIAASCAFMLPVATPPNAIVFASGEISIAQMCKAGLWLNVIGILLVTLIAYVVVAPVLGIAAP